MPELGPKALDQLLESQLEGSIKVSDAFRRRDIERIAELIIDAADLVDRRKLTAAQDGWNECTKLGHGLIAQRDEARTRVDQLIKEITEALSLAETRGEQLAVLREALGGMLLFFGSDDVGPLEHFETVATIFQNETGYLRPGKDCVVHDPELRRKIWDEWVVAKRNAAVAALTDTAKAAAQWVRVPEGWGIKPLVATEEMLEAGGKVQIYSPIVGHLGKKIALAVYGRMSAAAPQAGEPERE